MVRVSIITINYNNDKGLVKTVKSVASQSFEEFEYLVIDGGSTDNSRKVINDNKYEIDYWCSERDNGVYDAMNKGIQKATGEYVIFLNSGDYFYSSDSLKHLCRYIDSTDIIYGDLVVVENGKEWVKPYPEKLTFHSFVKDSLPHPCAIIRRSLFDQVGLYNTNLKICADWEFFLHAICRFNATYLHVSEPIAVFIADGMSSNPDNWRLIQAEKQEVLRKHYGAFLPDYEDYFAARQQLKNIGNSRLYKFLRRLWRLRSFSKTQNRLASNG